MRVVKSACPLLEAGCQRGLEIYERCKKKWPFERIWDQEHIAYSIAFALVALYDEQLKEVASLEEFIEFLSEFIKIHSESGLES